MLLSFDLTPEDPKKKHLVSNAGEFELRLKQLCCPHTHAHAHMLKHRLALTHAHTHTCIHTLRLTTKRSLTHTHVYAHTGSHLRSGTCTAITRGRALSHTHTCTRSHTHMNHRDLIDSVFPHPLVVTRFLVDPSAAILRGPACLHAPWGAAGTAAVGGLCWSLRLCLRGGDEQPVIQSDYFEARTRVLHHATVIS